MENQSINQPQTPQTPPPSPPTPNQPTPPLNQTPPQKKSGVNLLAIFFALLAIGATGAASYFGYQNYQLKQQVAEVEEVENLLEISNATPPQSPTPIPTTDPFVDWLTYTSDEYGFQFKYPSDYAPSGDPEMSFISPTDRTLTSFSQDFLMTSEDSSSQLFFLLQVSNGEEFGSNTSSLKIGDRSVQQYSGSFKNQPAVYYSFIEADKTVSFGLTNSTEEQHSSTIKTILSTFEFTDQTSASSIDTSEWETYTNTKYKYSINYPEDWKVQDESTQESASPTSDSIQIFNPNTESDDTFYSGMTISYAGGIMNTEGFEQTQIEGIENSAYIQRTSHGEIYYINIPDTDQYILIDGAGGYTNNETNNNLLREIFKSLEVTE